ncbi:MAG: Arabinose 5-phosphate isomerase KdsD [Elusimicrobia bacterium]|nr:Arabinose 5-phosphate isomerase KdsD [Elusimicrobiota bacterium]
MNIENEIKSVISTQAKSLAESKRAIGGAFKEAVNILYRCKGKVIVTGIGKSGLIAQKMASTLSSTGTPAIFMHPVEGMHGNLGLVQKSDVIFAIGKSGESEELINILPALHKIGAKVICLTAEKNSTLARRSSVALYVPVKREACPLNLAPTTSSTVALVVGDAIAITLMKMRGFNEQNFALYHPGGLLGRRLLLKMEDVMRGGELNPVVKVSDSMTNLLIEMSRKWTGAVSVVNAKKKLVGLVTDFDVRRAFAQGKAIRQVKIEQIMNPHPIFIYSDEMAVRALEIMESRKKPLTVLPVVDRKRRSVGMVHLHDLVRKGLVSGKAPHL